MTKTLLQEAEELRQKEFSDRKVKIIARLLNRRGELTVAKDKIDEEISEVNNARTNLQLDKWDNPNSIGISYSR